MKALIFVLVAFSLCSCSMIKPEYLLHLRGSGEVQRVPASGSDKTVYTWGLDRSNKAVMDKFYADKKECEDKAFALKAMGSKFTEFDIALGCMERRGYKLRKIAGN